MKKLIITLISLFALSLLFSATTFAQKRSFQKGMMKERFSEILKLTDEQRAEFEDLKDEHQLQAIDLHAELQKNKIKLKNLMIADNLDEKAVLSTVEKNNSIHNKLKIMKTEMLLKMRSALTSEQREKVKGLPMFGDGFGRGTDYCKGKGSRHARNLKAEFGMPYETRCRFR